MAQDGIAYNYKHMSINEVVCSHNFHIFNEFREEMFLAENCAHETFFEWKHSFHNKHYIMPPVSMLKVKANTK